MILWSSFIGYYGGATILYWVSVIVFVFKSKINGLFQRISNGRADFVTTEKFVYGSDPKESVRRTSTVDPGLPFEAVLSEIRAYLEQANREEAVRNEMLYSLQRIIGRHSVAPDNAVRLAISDRINEMTGDICEFSFSDDELRSLWVKL